MELHEYEVRLLPLLLKSQEFTQIVTLAKDVGLEEIQVRRAQQWLSNKDLITVKKETFEAFDLTKQGTLYAKEGTPELRVLLTLKKNKTMSRSELLKSISPQEFGAALGRLKKANAVEVTQDKEVVVSATKAIDNAIKQEESVVKLLKDLQLHNAYRSFNEKHKDTLHSLLERKGTLEKKTITSMQYILTAKGKKAAQQKHEIKAGKLTHEMLVTGKYKDAQFRAYGINDDVPPIAGGRKHFVTQAIEYIRNIWLELGFTQMDGDYVQSAFWDLDVLFVPQDHPARTMQDTFYLDHRSDLKEEAKLVQAIKKIHENGGNTGSQGWRYDFSIPETQRNLLRTHSTALSARMLYNLDKKNLPARYFAVGKVFRNETMDWSHLFEFHQVEGIVVDKDANFSNLLAYLKEFFGKMGYPDVRIRPAYFPYTEPSAEIEVYHPGRKVWVELGGCGIFRPEVVIPLLGEDIPVLAWGLGMERIIVEEFGFKDLRDLYRNDIEQLQTIKQFMRM